MSDSDNYNKSTGFNVFTDIEALQAKTARTVTGSSTLEEGTVENLLTLEEPKEEIPWQDIRIDTFSNGVPPTFMKLIHMPTGYFTEGKHASRNYLRKGLYKKLCAIMKEKNQ